LEPLNQFLLKLTPWQLGLILGGGYFLLSVANTFLPLVGTILIVFCGIYLFYAIFVSKGRIVKKLIPVVIAFVVVCVLIIGFFSLGNLRDYFTESEINKAGSSIDWGDDYYWDSFIEGVKKKFN
jgi:predicted PurR-regulated permease PerM